MFFYFILLLYADEDVFVWPHLCEFSLGSSGPMYVPDYPVSASPDFIVLYIVGRLPELLT